MGLFTELPGYLGHCDDRVQKETIEHKQKCHKSNENQPEKFFSADRPKSVPPVPSSTDVCPALQAFSTGRTDAVNHTELTISPEFA